MIVYTARHVLPVASPPLVDGAVAVRDGRIAAVGRKHEVLKAAGADAETRDLGDAVLLPGLVNAHTRIDLSWMRDDPPPSGDWAAWFRGVLERQARADDATVRAAGEIAVAAMAARGTVAVGDVAVRPVAAEVLARSTLHGVVFLELSGLRADEAERILDRAADTLDAVERSEAVRAAAGRIAVVLSPHGAHTTSGPLLKALAGRAAATGEILTVQAGESADESSMLHDGAGPLPEILRSLGLWDENWRAPGHSPIECLDRLGVLSSRTLVVHGVQFGAQDLSKLQARGATLVTCPRCNVRLGVGKTPVPKLLSMGIPVALGTGPLACVPDLDLFVEMAALRHEHPGLSPAAVVRMATLNGARALRLERQLGTIETGKLAGLAVVGIETPGDDPFEVVTSGPESASPLA